MEGRVEKLEGHDDELGGCVDTLRIRYDPLVRRVDTLGIRDDTPEGRDDKELVQEARAPDHNESGNATWNADASVEPLAQLRQHPLAVEFQEPNLIRTGCVEYQMTEPHLDIRFDLFDVLIGIGGNDPAAGGALDR